MNGLRISHESLNMDDIISELNPGSQAPSTVVQSQPDLSHPNDLETPHVRTQHQKITESNESVTKALKSPKKAQVGAAAHNGKKIAANNVKSSGYGQATSKLSTKQSKQTVKEQNAIDSSREQQKDVGANQKNVMQSLGAAR